MKWISREIKITLMALLLIITGIYLSGCVNSKHMRLGQQYAAAGDWDKSVQAFQKALEENPEDQEIRLLLFRSKKNASLSHLSKGEALLNKKRFDEATTEFQMSIAFDPANIKAESLFEEAGAMKESEHFLKKGQNLEKAQKYSQAKENFQKALELNPANEMAESALSRYREKETALPPKYSLKLKKEGPISLRFKNTPILNIFEVLTRLTGINFIFDKDIKETKVTFFLSDVPFDQFLEIFLRTNKLAAALVNEKTMIIYPDTPQKAKEYQDLQIRTFYLAYLDVKKAVALLTKILKSKNISANENLNAVVIRGPKDVIEVASKIIEANDRPSSEVILSVEILEVSRTKEQQLGLELSPTSITVGLGGPTSDFYTLGGAGAPASGGASLDALDRTSDKNILVSIPTATLNLLKRDGDTKTLAKPQIRVKNRGKAKIHIGERIPLRTNRRVEAGTGAVTSDYQYQDVGVKLNVEPVINVHDEITLKLTLEVSSIGDNVGTAADPQYSIKTRTVQSVMSVRAGESVIIGGLISDEERKTVRKVPLLGEIPVLGYLFSSYDTNDVQMDILMAITPIIVRSQEIPNPDVARIWSGKEQNFSLRGPYAGPEDHEEVFLDQPRDEFIVKPEGPPDTGPADERNNDFPPGKEDSGGPPEGPPATAPPGTSKPIKEPEPLTSPTDDRPPPPQTSMNRPEEKSPARPLQTDEPGDQGRAPFPEKPVAQDKNFSLTSIQNSFPYTIQVNSYIHKKDAEKRVENLTRLEYDCFTHSGYIPSNDKTVYRVFVGKYVDFKSAEEACKALRSKKVFRKDIYVVNRRWALTAQVQRSVVHGSRLD